MIPIPNGFAQRFGGPVIQPGGPIQLPAGAAPTGQLPAPAPVAPVQMPNAFAQHILAPPSGGNYGVRSMMPPAMPAASSPNPFNDLRTRLGIRPL